VVQHCTMLQSDWLPSVGNCGTTRASIALGCDKDDALVRHHLALLHLGCGQFRTAESSDVGSKDNMRISSI